jgi:hypothetical protein
MARPYVRRPVTLLIAVPVASVIGMLVLGVVVLVVIVAIRLDLGDTFVPDWGGRKGKRRRAALPDNPH